MVIESVGSAPPLGIEDRSRHNLTPNITGGIRRRLRTGHRPGTDPLPVGSHRAPSEQPTHNHASAELVPESGRQHIQGEERERREREREERGEGEGVCTREEWGGCLWWAVVLLRGYNHAPLRSLR